MRNRGTDGRGIRYRGFRVTIQTLWRPAAAAFCATAIPVGPVDYTAHVLASELGALADPYGRDTCRSVGEDCLRVAEAKVRNAIDRTWARLDADGPCLGYSREVDVDGWGLTLCVRQRGDGYFVVVVPTGDLVGNEEAVEAAFQRTLYEMSHPWLTYDDPVDAVRTVEGHIRSIPRRSRRPQNH